MLTWLRQRQDQRQKARSLYGSIVTQARSRGLYNGCGVPDTKEGRFEMIALHLVLALRRLADTGDPGEAMEVPTRSVDRPPGETSGAEAPEYDQETAEEVERHWIAIRLKNADGAPVPYEPYRLKLPDGTVTTGRLNNEGMAKVEGIDEGTCEVNFPSIHGDEWRPA